MLEETDKAISSIEEITKDINKIIFKLLKYMVKNNIKKYTIGNYILKIQTKKDSTSYCLNDNYFSHKAILAKKKQKKSFFKIKIFESIFIVYFKQLNFDWDSINYGFEDTIGIEEIEDVIEFFSLFNEDINAKTIYMLTHKEQIEAFDKLLQNS
jgi:hypothetical protein